MTLVELKKFINNNIRPSDFMIFVQKDCSYLANQYTQSLGKLATGGIRKINSIYEPSQSSLVLLIDNEDTLNVLKVETFDERAEDYSQFENTIVVCDQIDKNIVGAVADYIVTFPKLEEWQIFDYAKTLCPGLEDEDITWLIKASENNIDRVLTELEKVRLFDKAIQKEIFSAVRFDPQSDLYKVDLFATVNALVDGNTVALFEFLSRNDYESLDPVVLANRALTSLKNIIFVSQNPTLSAEECGVSNGQHRFLKYNYKSLNLVAAKEKLKFLTNFDLMLKTSKLELNKRDMLNYLINHLTYRITF